MCDFAEMLFNVCWHAYCVKQDILAGTISLAKSARSIFVYTAKQGSKNHEAARLVQNFPGQEWKKTCRVSRSCSSCCSSRERYNIVGLARSFVGLAEGDKSRSVCVVAAAAAERKTYVDPAGYYSYVFFVPPPPKLDLLHSTTTSSSATEPVS